MKEDRVDKAKNKAKIIKERIENPLQTTRDIAKKIWLDHSTVAKLDKELPQITTKSQDILEICKTDFEIVRLWQKEINRRLWLKEELEKMRTFEIAQTIEKSEKRYMLFKWNATDWNWWLNIEFSETQTWLLLARMNEIYGKGNDWIN